MERLYRFVLGLYPAHYRHEFSDEMAYVFCQAYLDATDRGLLARAAFLSRELLGLLSGASREHLAVFVDSHLAALFHPRRFAMRTNQRFPLSAVIFMLLSLLAVVYTINQAAAVQASLPAVNPVLDLRPVHIPLPGGILVLFAIAYFVGILGWLIAFALRRAGVQRLSRTETWSGAK